MATTRAGRMTRSDPRKTTAARAAAIAEQLRHESSILLELYRKKESFTADVSVAEGHLVSCPPPSSQLDTRDKLWRLHSALLQCHMLMERAIAKEEEELGGDKEAEYETQRKMVKDRLSLLLINTGELLKVFDGSAVQTFSKEGLGLDSLTTVFDLKLWVYKVFREVDYWAKTAITTLQALPSVIGPSVRTARVRSTRNTR